MSVLDPTDRVEPGQWRSAVERAYDEGCTFFDFLTAVDRTDDPSEPGFDVLLRVVNLWDPPAVAARVLRTRVAEHAILDSITPVFAGAAWHEREVSEMFGLGFSGFEDGSDLGLRRLLLPASFEGAPLRKSFVLAARAVEPWPGAGRPGGDDAPGVDAPGVDGGGGRRRVQTHGVPDPSWGPR
ncbi:MAG: NADH-quinone oxidoreductase subunit C [Dermatophilaceae bacterium]